MGIFWWLKETAALMATKGGGVIKFFLAKWYRLIMIPAIAAAVYVIKGLHESGLLAKIENLIVTSMASLVNIAKYCTPQIAHGIKPLLNCLGAY